MATPHLPTFGELPHYLPKVMVRSPAPNILYSGSSGMGPWVCHSDALSEVFTQKWVAWGGPREGGPIFLDRVQQRCVALRSSDGCTIEFLMQKWTDGCNGSSGCTNLHVGLCGGGSFSRDGLGGLVLRLMPQASQQSKGLTSLLFSLNQPKWVLSFVTKNSDQYTRFISGKVI